MSKKEDFSGLAGSHKTLADASEVMAAFISTTRSDEMPSDSMMQAAGKTLAELAEWRKRLRR